MLRFALCRVLDYRELPRFFLNEKQERQEPKVQKAPWHSKFLRGEKRHGRASRHAAAKKVSQRNSTIGSETALIARHFDSAPTKVLGEDGEIFFFETWLQTQEVRLFFLAHFFDGAVRLIYFFLNLFFFSSRFIFGDFFFVFLVPHFF